jgi:hypothetical protein
VTTASSFSGQEYMGGVLDVIHYAVGVSVLDVVRSKLSEFGKTADREQKLLCLSSRIAQCVPPFWFVVKRNLGSGVAFTEHVEIAVPTVPSTPNGYRLYLLGAYAAGSGTSDATPQIISAMFRPARKATGMPCPV